jgi:hypothetical protein
MERTCAVQPFQSWFQKVIRAALEPFLTYRDDPNDPVVIGLPHPGYQRPMRNRHNR